MRSLVLSLLLALAACGPEDARPEGTLPPEKFEQVLMGALLIEARLNHEMVVDKRADVPVQQYYDTLFKEQGVTEQEFKATYDHYVRHPEELKRIYERVLNDIQQHADSTAR